jgi:hypothetical protein
MPLTACGSWQRVVSLPELYGANTSPKEASVGNEDSFSGYVKTD